MSRSLLDDLKNFLINTGLNTIVSNTAELDSIGSSTSVLPNMDIEIDTIQSSVSVLPNMDIEIDTIQSSVSVIPNMDIELNTIQSNIASIATDAGFIQNDVSIIDSVRLPNLQSDIDSINSNTSFLGNIDAEIDSIQSDTSNLPAMAADLDSIQSNIPEPVSGEVQVATARLTATATAVAIGGNTGIRVHGIRLGVESFSLTPFLTIVLREVTSGLEKYRTVFQAGESSEGGMEIGPLYVRAIESLELTGGAAATPIHYTIYYTFD